MRVSCFVALKYFTFPFIDTQKTDHPKVFEGLIEILEIPSFFVERTTNVQAFPPSLRCNVCYSISDDSFLLFFFVIIVIRVFLFIRNVVFSMDFFFVNGGLKCRRFFHVLCYFKRRGMHSLNFKTVGIKVNHLA